MLWFVICWRPVVPEVDYFLAWIMSSLTSMVSILLCYNNTHGDSKDFSVRCSGIIKTVLNEVTWIQSKFKAGNA